MVARDKREWEMGSDCLMDMRFPFGVMKMFWNDCGDGCIVHVLNAAELYMLQWLT